MVEEKGRKRSPPYVSYHTFRNFVDGLQQGGLPARIDRSYWGETLSGSTGTQLMAALRFLGLVDSNGTPTNQLKQLALARGDLRTRVLNEIANEAFAFVMDGALDLQTTTYSQLQELFHATFQLTGDVGRKCIKFFVALSGDAMIPLSPHVTKRVRTKYSGTGIKPSAKKGRSRTNRKVIVPQNLEQIRSGTSLDEILLTKFPAFDPAWPDEVKVKWFEAFDQLLKRNLAPER